MERIIDISDEGARLSVRYDQLRIQVNGAQESVPLDEIAAVIVSHPAVVFTHAVLAGLASSGAAFIACDEHRLPVAMLLPLQSHFVQSERLESQVSATQPLKKQLWRQIVIAKVRAQAAVLETINGDDAGLLTLSRRVVSGDSTNIEAQAAQRYWPCLFGDAFLRRPQVDDGVNSLLNYGYAVLRATVARAICAVGLHPSLGLHHHNRYDAFCLANDLMEPFRPVVDRQVAAAVGLFGFAVKLEKETKRELIEALVKRRYRSSCEERTLPDWLGKMTASLVEVFNVSRRRLLIPEFVHEAEETKSEADTDPPF